MRKKIAFIQVSRRQAKADKKCRMGVSVTSIRADRCPNLQTETRKRECEGKVTHDTCKLEVSF